MSTREEQIEKFWSNYLERLQKKRVEQHQQRWYTIRAEQFLDAIKPRRLAALGASDVADYLARKGREGALTAFQFRQMVDAIRTLGEVAGAAWVAEVDWGHWLGSAQVLAANHPTVARDYGPAVGGLEPLGEVGNLAAVRREHQAVVDRMVTEIRKRGYSIRTERSYTDWVLRLIAYCGGKEPEALGSADVTRFMSWLAVERKVSASTQNQALNGVLFLFREVLGREGPRRTVGAVPSADPLWRLSGRGPGGLRRIGRRGRRTGSGLDFFPPAAKLRGMARPLHDRGQVLYFV